MFLPRLGGATRPLSPTSDHDLQLADTSTGHPLRQRKTLTPPPMNGRASTKKKTARPVSWSRRFARTFVERSSRSPRGAAGHNPLRDREWPVKCGIPARHHHPRGASAPCAWSVRIGPLHRFPVASSPREEVRYSVEDDFAGALQRPISSFRHREKPYGPSLHPAPAHRWHRTL